MPLSPSALKADLFEKVTVLLERWKLAESKIKEAKATIASETITQDKVRADYNELKTAGKVFGIDLDALIEERFKAADSTTQNNQMDLLSDIPQAAPVQAPARQRSALTIREEILAIALGIYPRPVRATPLREELEKTRGWLHEKTVGMTLYRLSREGLMRRDGRNWFYVPPVGRTQNPGGDTPGPINADNEEGEEL